MNPIKITVKSQKLNQNSVQWRLSINGNSHSIYMYDTIYRPDVERGTGVAELAAIWTGFQEIRGYEWVEINCSRETETYLQWFLYGKPPAGYEAAYRHLSGYLARHDVMINPDPWMVDVFSSIIDASPKFCTRIRRASQLVSMGAIWRHPKLGYSCWTKSHPENPYHIKRADTGQWECSCPDSAPTIPIKEADVPLCKHMWAAMMDYRLSAQRVRQVVPIQKAA